MQNLESLLSCWVCVGGSIVGSMCMDVWVCYMYTYSSGTQGSDCRTDGGHAGRQTSWVHANICRPVEEWDHPTYHRPFPLTNSQVSCNHSNPRKCVTCTCAIPRHCTVQRSMIVHDRWGSVLKAKHLDNTILGAFRQRVFPPFCRAFSPWLVLDRHSTTSTLSSVTATLSSCIKSW